MFSSSTDTLHFMVEVRATGWIGFGFATQAPTIPYMLGYDVAVGGVESGSGYLRVNVFLCTFLTDTFNVIRLCIVVGFSFCYIILVSFNH